MLANGQCYLLIPLFFLPRVSEQPSGLYLGYLRQAGVEVIPLRMHEYACNIGALLKSEPWI